MPTSLKVTSGASGFKVIDPFNWSKDKLSTSNGNYGQRRLGTPLKQWKETQTKTKISYFHHWIDGEGMGHIKSWRSNKILISQVEYDRLEEHEKEGKYSSEKIETYFTLFESLLAPKSNPFLAVEELHFAKQGSRNSGEFDSYVVKTAKRCRLPNQEA